MGNCGVSSWVRGERALLGAVVGESFPCPQTLAKWQWGPWLIPKVQKTNRISRNHEFGIATRTFKVRVCMLAINWHTGPHSELTPDWILTGKLNMQGGWLQATDYVNHVCFLQYQCQQSTVGGWRRRRRATAVSAPSDLHGHTRVEWGCGLSRDGVFLHVVLVSAVPTSQRKLWTQAS